MTDAQITRLVAEKVMGWTWMVEIEGWAERPLALADLLPRQHDVLSLLYGMNGESKHSREEAGRRLHITAERIRAIQSTVLKCLRVHLVFSPLTSEADSAAVLDKMAESGRSVCVERIDTHGEEGWIARIGNAFDGGWQQPIRGVNAASRRRAICLAALAAVGVEVGE
jgi:hypothetical protein